MDNFVGLKKWQLFANTDVNILAQITLCHVFSETRTQLGVIYIDHKDQVFAKGYNDKFNKLGIQQQDINRYNQPSRHRNAGETVESAIRIPELSGETISSILTGYRHGAAMSKNGNVFFWGLDLSCEDYSERKVTRAPKLLNNGELMKGERARQIACSGNALGIITRTGKLLVWGLWTGPNSATVLNQEVVMDVEPRSIVGGGWHFAVTSLYQQLYTFGDGGSGQLGYEWDCEKDVYTRPKRVDLPEPAMSVACSQLATLVYLQPWALYIFGENTNGRLGVQSRKDCISTPTRINLSDPIQYVLASLYDSVFYAVTSTPKKMYRWGYDASLIKPQAIEVNTTMEAFANRSIPVCDMLPDSDSVSAPTLIPEMNSTGQLNELCDQELFF
uniref:Rho GTPase-activating protein gacGG n=1 Tax=Lygus hesperus TaxID=30085 RepID=A0A146M016_LYGHE